MRNFLIIYLYRKKRTILYQKCKFIKKMKIQNNYYKHSSVVNKIKIQTVKTKVRIITTRHNSWRNTSKTVVIIESTVHSISSHSKK